MKPCFHMAGFLGTNSPIFDIGKYYELGDRKDMLVSNTRFGSALASHFGDDEIEPGYAVVLMRGHGFTVQGDSIQDVVLRAVYTQQNAGIQTTSLITRAAHFGVNSGEADGGIRYLSQEETEGATVMTKWSARRPWGLWLREVEAHPMYVNLERSRLQ
jgi:ribulose-5-phosphate 4-epimerase/fuculose-1-phosphate aldolase